MGGGRESIRSKRKFSELNCEKVLDKLSGLWYNTIKLRKGGITTQAHNDYIRLIQDYGWIDYSDSRYGYEDRITKLYADFDIEDYDNMIDNIFELLED